MISLGLLMMLGLAQLVLGPVMSLLVRRATRGRRGTGEVGCFALFLPLLCGMALFSGLIWYEEVAADFSTGGDEYFWTPLGGGYFASSVSDGENTLIEHGKSTASLPPALWKTDRIQQFGCAGGQPVLALNGRSEEPTHAFVLVNPPGRSLEVAQTERQLTDLALRRGLTIPEWWSEREFQEKCGPHMTAGQQLYAGVALLSPLLLVFGLFVGALVRVSRCPRVAVPYPEYELDR